MNIKEMFGGAKTQEAVKESFNKHLELLHSSSNTPEELEQKLQNELFVKELMQEISKVNGGINVMDRDKNVCYLIDKLKWVDGSIEIKGGTPTYSMTFSTKDAVTQKPLGTVFDYVQNSSYENGDLLITHVGAGKSLTIDELKNQNAPVHFNGDEQARFFSEIKDVIAKFVKDKSQQV